MQLFVLAMVVALLIHPSGFDEAAIVAASPWRLAAVVLLPKILLAAIYYLLCRITLRRLSHVGGTRTLTKLDWATSAFRYLSLLLYGIDVRGLNLYGTGTTVGLLDWLRYRLGGSPTADPILLDEIGVMLPTLGLMVFAWWAYYPIDRRLREAAIHGRADAGLPVHPVWSRTQYIVSQLRHQIALMLVPLLAMIGWAELVDRYVPGHAESLIDLRGVAVFAGAGCVFLFAPVMIRHMWDTVPLPAGPLRDRLTAMCKLHRVRVRELLLWRTFGGLINAAVMGIIAPLRYVLLTDALLDNMPGEQVEAVMAHELAHVKRHHMFWLLVAAAGAMFGLEMFFNEVATAASPFLSTIASAIHEHGMDVPGLSIEKVSAGAAAVAWIFAFGWLSRRFERQADTFAVQHLAKRDKLSIGESGKVLVDPLSADTMIGALQSVAELNHIATKRRSWRHGSIAWRQDYLHSLVGQPIDDLAIDRLMVAINLSSAAILIAAVALGYAQGSLL